jgi:hypothetical protein
MVMGDDENSKNYNSIRTFVATIYFIYLYFSD